MKSSLKGLEVFDFDANDDLAEKTAERFMGKGKLRNPKIDASPITKYQFLECFSRGTNYQQAEISDVPCVDVDSSNSGHKSKNQGLYTLGTLRGDDATTEGISELDEVLVSNTTGNDSHPDNITRGNFFPGGSRVNSRGWEDLNLGIPSDGKQANSVLLDPPSDSDPVDVISDDKKSTKANCLSTHSSDIEGNEASLEDSASDLYSSDWDTENTDLAVVVTPDYLTYGERYCTDSLITFSCSCIKLEGTNAYGNKESFSSEWPILEVVGIESQWYLTVETALIKLYIRPSAETEAENVDGTSGILELKFAVCDPCWAKKLERIMSLEARYRTVLIDTDAVEDGFVGKNGISSSKHYFPSLNEPFEDVIYPLGDPDAVSISKRDVELLQPQTFINDTIIDFYIKYLKKKIPAEDGHRFHFFNSFFFRKLADLDKDPPSASQGRAAFQRVRKWTRKVNLFEKDYVFIPVNFNLHWSLIVICHPGEVANFKDEDIDKSLQVPCILHMDSIKGSHKGLKNLVQSYLWEEWKEKTSESSEDLASKFLNLRFVPLQLPQQENSFDCGLFLLHYVELFLDEAPVYFSPLKITKWSNFLNVDWFPPAEASLKRAFIQNLIYELVEENSERTTATNNVEHHSSGFTENENRKENGVEFLSEIRSPSRNCYGNLTCPTAGQGIQIELLATSSGGAERDRDSGLVLKELFERGTTAGSFTNEQFRPSNNIEPLHRFNGITSPIEENTETDEQYASSPSSEAGFQPLERLGTEFCSTSFSTRGFCMIDSFWNPGMSDQEDKNEDGGSSLETSSFGSQDASELREGVNLQPSDFVYKREQEETAKPRSLPPGNVGFITGSPASASSDEGLDNCIIEDSQESDMMAESKEGNNSYFSCQENPSASPDQAADLGEKRNMQSSGSDPTSESDEQGARKRQRLVPTLDGERRRTISIKKD